jgi:hypothetical protein
MIDGAASISERLGGLSAAIRVIGMQVDADDERRFILSSADLIEREHDKLARGIAADDDMAVAWALRSVADMMKGLIDIGSDLPNLAPALWDDAKNLARQAHDAERHARRP